MKVWIPNKGQVEDMLWLIHLELKQAKSVSEVAEDLVDKLTTLSCHIANLANEERKHG
jgi:hypothetical protein